MYDILELNEKLVGELREIAKGLNIENADGLKKQELVYKILDLQAVNPEAVKGNKKEAEPKPAKVVTEKPERVRKPERIAKPEKPEKTEKAEKIEKPGES